MPDQQNPALRLYSVHVDDQPRHCRHLQGASFEDAALHFVSDWHPDNEEVTVIVTDEATGRRECFRIDLASGSSGPCDL